ncbi:hypothetical protein TCDM_11893 [Trypanosoma cruzi Dm28c]|uniref:Uncharacterized protein n=1 Tax=Trypanosoma cruzi Dm28c TaxID=1416333 RepID=V5B8C4_TRYCR|nr:hypothetical protein TCDM_11893 [Trypanosoma cruzi Dm28c]
MESTRPLAYCRVVIYGSNDFVEYFVRTMYDGRTVMPTQMETKTGWFMSPVKLRSKLRHWMRAEKVALRCLLASRLFRWLIVKGIQEHSFPEEFLLCCTHTAVSAPLGFFFGGRMVCCTSCTTVNGEGHGATCLPLRCWRTACLHPLYAGGTILRSRMKATCSCHLPAMNGLLVIYFRAFLLDNEFANGYEGCVFAGFERGFFFMTGGVKELQALADVIAGVRAGV